MKKTKNAFTLIELLAVIVILALIVIVAPKIISNISKDTKNDTNEDILYENGQRVYFDVKKGIGCTMEEYASSYDNGDFRNSLTDYNGINGVNGQNSCLLFYAFNDEGGDNLNLILDHNTTGTTHWTNSTISSNINGPITVLSELKSDTSSWNGTITPEDYIVAQDRYGNYTIPYKTDSNGAYKARLITAQEIAKITGADIKEGLMFNENTSNYSKDQFYFDGLNRKASSTCTDGKTTGCRFGWLYDRTAKFCEKYGCYNNSDSMMLGAGYWTSTSTYGSSTNVWNITSSGQLTFFRPSIDGYGVRPVITVPKSKITPGEAPVIPQS